MNKKQTTGIYCITNKITGKKYIGCSKNIEHRFKQHTHSKKYRVSLITQSILKYGKNNFEFSILLSCPSLCFDYWERYFISQHNSVSPNGYNLTYGGEYKKEVSEITKKKLSDSHKGHTPFNKGKKLTPHHLESLKVPKTKTKKLEEYWERLRGVESVKKGKGYILYIVKDHVNDVIVRGTSFEMKDYCKKNIEINFKATSINSKYEVIGKEKI